jgi:hypothetical protein
MYAAMTKDEENATDGRFSTACIYVERVRAVFSHGTIMDFYLN